MTANFVRFVFETSAGFVMIMIIKLLSSISAERRYTGFTITARKEILVKQELYFVA